MRTPTLTIVIALFAACGAAAGAASAQDVPTLRFSRQTAAEDNLWLMLAKPELAPNLNKAYKVEWSQMRASEAAYKAFEGGQIDFASVSGNSAIAAAAAGIDLKIIATLSREVAERRQHQVPGQEGRAQNDRRSQGRHDRHRRLPQRGRTVGARRPQERRAQSRP